MSLITYFVSLLALTTSVSACAYGTSIMPRAEGTVKISSFGYTGLIGPLNWAALDTTANALCSTGTSQSPIDLTASTFTKEAGSGFVLKIADQPAGAEFENLGTNVEVVVNGTLENAGKTFKMAQFHFHTPSEHRLDGEYFAMETHFVFESEAKEIAVVAFLIDIGPTDPLLAEVFSKVSEIATPGSATTTPPLGFAALSAHLAANDVLRYSGSLTTPPCSEGVQWMISSKPLTIDANTFESAKAVLNFNSRFTQNDPKTVNLIENAAKVLATPAGAAQAGAALPALPGTAGAVVKEGASSKVEEKAATKTEAAKSVVTIGAGVIPTEQTEAVKKGKEVTGGQTIETATGLKVTIGPDGSVSLG